MTTIVGTTSSALTSLLAAKADLAGGVLPDSQAPAISVKKDTWVVDLNDHGGVGDGATSNDAAFVSALAAINPTWGGKIVIRAGSYLINGTTAITLSNVGTIIEGSGAEATKIIVGSGFTGTDVFAITAANCQVRDLSIVGSNTTTASNPVAHGIYINNIRGCRVLDCNFWYVNGWGIHATGGSGSGTNPSGTMLSRLIMRNCAGGIRFFGNAGSGSVSSFVTDVQIISTGVSTGTSANLDGLNLEDAWDVNMENVISWLTAGTGNALHIKGNCITNTFRGMDLEGSNAAPTVYFEDGPNGYAYNAKIDCGTVQLGTIGIRVTGQAKVVSFSNLNIVNNKTHGVSVEGTGNPINLRGCYFVANGTGASGTNYDINWTGASIGFVTDPRFESAIVATGTAGVQVSINVPASQNVRLIDTSFAGTGASSSNWATNTPNAWLDTTTGAFDFLTRISTALGIVTQGNVSSQPSSSSNTVFSSNVGGTSAFDNFRFTADGTINAGTGTAARDTTWGRQGAAQFGTSDSDLVIGLGGKGLKIRNSGAATRIGTAVLTAGTVVVNNTSVTASTAILLGGNQPAGTPGALYVSAVTAGTSFTVKSTSSTDTSRFSYVLIEAI